MATENQDGKGVSETTEEESQEAQKQQQQQFTQEDVNRLLAKNKRELREELETLRGQNKKYEEEITSFKAFQKNMEDSITKAGLRFSERGIELSEEEEDGPDDFLNDYANPPKGVNPDFYRKFKKFEVGSSRVLDDLISSKKETDTKISTLLQQIEEERTVRKQAEERAREVERGQLLYDALNKANCIDLEGGRRYFRDQTKYVDGRGWMYVPRGATDPEDFIGIEDGIKKEIPDYLKKSSTTRGGSGSTGQTGNEATTDLKVLQQQVEDAQKRAIRTNNPADLSRYMQAKREFAQELKNRGLNQQ